MSIFVTKDGSQLGPYTPQSLWAALSSGALAGDDPAWLEGGDEISTVGKLVRAPAGEQADAQRRPDFIGTSVPTIRPRSATPTAIPVATSPSNLPVATPTANTAVSYAEAEAPEPFPIERFRFIGAATPLLVLLIMLIPWAVDERPMEFGTVSGYTLFTFLPMPALLFAIASGGIGLYGFQGATDGGIRDPLLALGCSFFAICTLAYITIYYTRSVYTPLFESGEIELGAGWFISMATVLIGTAGAVIPSSEFDNSAKIGSWIVSGAFAIAGIIFIFLGLR